MEATHVIAQDNFEILLLDCKNAYDGCDARWCLVGDKAGTPHDA